MKAPISEILLAGPRGFCAGVERAIDIVEEAALAPDSLAAAIDHAARRARGPRVAIDMNGAQRSAALLAEWTAALAW